MFRYWTMRLHRWISLTFALPLLVLLATGLLLAFEPIAQGQVEPGLVTSARIVAALERYDPTGTAQAVMLRPHDGSLVILAKGGRTEVDLATGEPFRRSALTLTELFQQARRIHEHLFLEGKWLTITSTVAMLLTGIAGVLMGWPSLANTLSGWHKGAAWLSLPLTTLSVVTALMLSAGIGMLPPRGGAMPGAKPTLVEAVKLAGRDHDLSGMTWLRARGDALMLRIYEHGEAKVYTIGGQGLAAQPRNWPRLLHEGNWGGVVPALLNATTALAALIMLVTGVVIWSRRALRRRSRKGDRLA